MTRVVEIEGLGEGGGAVRLGAGPAGGVVLTDDFVVADHQERSGAAGGEGILEVFELVGVESLSLRRGGRPVMRIGRVRGRKQGENTDG